MTGNISEPYLVQAAADASVELRIAGAAVREILMEAMRGFGVTRRRGAEIGGLLIGSARRGVIVVEEIEVVPCEYAYGPSYLLSGNDTPKFAEAAARRRPAPGVDKYALGWFRSHTRDGLRPDAADIEVSSTHFPTGPSALLLIKPYATRTPDAALFVSQNGRLVTDSVLEFPFIVPVGDAPAPGPGIAAPPAREAPPVVRDLPPQPVKPPEPPHAAALPLDTPLPPVAAPRPIPESPLNPSLPEIKPVVLPRLSTEKERILHNVLGPKLPEAEDRRAPVHRDLFTDYAPKPGRAWLRGLSWTAFTLAAVLFGYAVGYRQAGGNLSLLLDGKGQAPPKDAFALNLSVRPRGDSILIQWDRQSGAVQRASQGNLVILSPEARNDVRLEVAEVRSGMVLYKTDASEAEIRLELTTGPGRIVAEQTTWKRDGNPQQ